MSAPPPPSTLERPPAELLQRFHAGMIGRHTIREYLEKGFSLAICCKDCPRLTEWTPPELERRFGDRLGLKVGDLAAKLACTGEGGCGSHDIAVFAHCYDGDWQWRPSRRGQGN